MIREFDNTTFDLQKVEENLIKVIGVGGGGGNAINYMYEQGIQGVDYIICNTDRQALEGSPILTKIHLGKELTEGLGAGSLPEIGEKAAEESAEEIRAALGSKAKMVFVTAGMGGGTGTGAAPVIARICREMGILTVGIVTSPFYFEGRPRYMQAQKGIDKLRKELDTLIVINNDKLLDIYGDFDIETAFVKVDEVLTIAAKGITELINKKFTMNIDLRDAYTVLVNSGTAIMGTGYGEGENRAMDAVKSSLASPLLNDNCIAGAKNVLLLILYGNEKITVNEMGLINKYIQQEAANGINVIGDNQANIIMGVGKDLSLEDKIMVTVIATGFSSEQQHEIIDVEPKKIVHSLDENTQVTQEFDTKPSYSNISLNKPAEKKEKIVYKLEDPISEQQATSKSDMGITLHTKQERKAIPSIDPDLYQTPIQFEIVSPIVAAQQQENFVIYEKKTTAPTKPTTAVPQRQVERKVVYMEQPEAVAVMPQPSMITTQEGGKIVHHLDDYLEMEQMLIHAKSPHEAEQEPLKAEIPTKEPVKAKEQAQPQAKEPNQNAYIAALKENAANRKTAFKHMSHQFSSQNNYRLEDLENTPAYVRMNVDLSSITATPTVSRSSISLDSNNIVQIRENNSYLHDNVD